MHRLTSRTYGRDRARPNTATTAFDSAFGDGRPAAVRASANVKRWGKTSFTSVRGGGDASPKQEASQKRVFSDAFDDSFSFHEDDTDVKTPKKSPTKGSPYKASSFFSKSSSIKPLSSVPSGVDKKGGPEKPRVRKILSGSGKSYSRALYNARKWQTEADNDEPFLTPLRRVARPALRPGRDPKVALKVKRDHKPLFTVRKVKAAHECQESGETLWFMEDVEYFCEGLNFSHNVQTRCLSLMNLAKKCMEPAFRMHLRQHGFISKILGALSDAYQFPTLSLCTATVIFVLSRDRLDLELDAGSVTLLVRLLLSGDKSPRKVQVSGAEMNRCTSKVKDVISELKRSGGAKDFDHRSISVGSLAVEALLQVMSGRVGDWVKDQVRDLGALDTLADTVNRSVQELPDDPEELTDGSFDALRRLERCARVLEQVTYMKSDNQEHLIFYDDSNLLEQTVRCVRLCERAQLLYPLEEDLVDQAVDKHSPAYAVCAALLACLRLLLNLTNDSEVAAVRVGNCKQDIITSTVTCVLLLPHYVTPDHKYALAVLGLTLLSNICDQSYVHRLGLMEAECAAPYTSPGTSRPTNALEALIQLFEKSFVSVTTAGRDWESQQAPLWVGGAQAERTGGAEGEGLEWVSSQPTSSSSGAGDSQTSGASVTTALENNDLDLALHHAGQHMRDTFIAAFVSLLIGCLVQDNEGHQERVRGLLVTGSFAPMIRVLYKFLSFMSLTIPVDQTASITRIIEVLESAEKRHSRSS